MFLEPLAGVDPVGVGGLAAPGYVEVDDGADELGLGFQHGWSGLGLVAGVGVGVVLVEDLEDGLEGVEEGWVGGDGV